MAAVAPLHGVDLAAGSKGLSNGSKGDFIDLLKFDEVDEGRVCVAIVNTRHCFTGDESCSNAESESGVGRGTDQVVESMSEDSLHHAEVQIITALGNCNIFFPVAALPNTTV